MRKIIYHVAISLDGFIAQKDGSAKGFLEEGEHIPDYLNSLSNYDTVIMGRKTYEFGYDFGLEPGQPAYPHMQHYIFSKTLELPPHEQVKIIRANEVDLIKKIKTMEGSPIYLCGGGQFAGFLLEHELIDEALLKVNPVIFGEGIPLFGFSKKSVQFQLQDLKRYESGVLLIDYQIIYNR